MLQWAVVVTNKRERTSSMQWVGKPMRGTFEICAKVKSSEYCAIS